jgi:hypothetical protein
VVPFFNKANILQALDAIPGTSKVTIGCSKSKSLAYDVAEIIKNYESSARIEIITLEKINSV